MMSLCFYILFAVQKYSNREQHRQQLIHVLRYTDVHLPFLTDARSRIRLYLAHSLQPKTPIVEMRPYKVYGVSSVYRRHRILIAHELHGSNPSSLLFSTLQSWGLDLSIALAVALFISVAPAAMVDMKLAKAKSSMEAGITSFLRDLTEVQKTGLSPEKCIESLSTRDYGAFSKELRKISSDISWGIPLKRVMMDFLHRTRSWMVQIVMFLLVETIDVGGGTIAMIESLARFNSLTAEVDKKENVRSSLRDDALFGVNFACGNNCDDDEFYIRLRRNRRKRLKHSCSKQRHDANGIHDRSYLQQLCYWNCGGENK